MRPGSNAAEVVARCEGRAEEASICAAAAWADVVFLAVPHTAVLDLARSAGDLAGKVVVVGAQEQREPS